MSTTVKEMIAAADDVVPRINAQEAMRLVRERDAMLVDVRDGREVETTGKAKGAVNVARGMLEFRADPESPYHQDVFRKDRPVILYCASGGRSALAGKTMKDLGYGEVYNLGGFKEWAENGGDVEPA